MKRIQEAYKRYPSGLIYGGKNSGVSECRLQNFDCCPHFLGLGDDIDEETKVGEYGDIKGCRGITCLDCWYKEI